MLKSVKISNFGPIDEEITFTMEKGKTEQFPENVIERTDLLKTILIYGKNNSGKSRFINAFKMLRDFIVDGKKIFDNADFFPCIWNKSTISKFCFKFLIENKVYDYILTIDFSKEEVHMEALSVDGESIFLRRGKKVLLGDSLKKLISDIKLTDKDIGNTQNKVEIMEKKFEESGIELNEISEKISYITFNFNKLKDNEEIEAFYKYIEKIFFLDQQRKNDGDNFYAGFDEELIDYVEKNGKIVNNALKKFGFDFKISVKEENLGFKQGRIINVIKVNDKSDYGFDFDILLTESFGTITFLKLLLMALSQCDKSFLMVIDEIERGVHPLLVANFIKYMNQYFPTVQLILPTHMTDLLSIDLNLRKDQMYITDIKDGQFSIKRAFNKNHIRETMNFQKILKSNAVGGNPEINIDNENEES